MNIGFTGPFCDNNLGDYAMLVNNVLDFSKELHPQKIYLFCYDDAFLRKIVDDYLNDLPVILVKVDRYEEQIAQSQSKKYNIVYQKVDFNLQDILGKVNHLDQIEEAVLDVDVMVLSGGGCMNYYWLAKHRKNKLFSMLVPLIVARNSGKKIISTGNTFGPFGENEQFFSKALSYIAFDQIGVRDVSFSRKTLQKIGIEDNVSDLIDDVYMLNPKLKNEQISHLGQYIVLELYSSMKMLEKIVPQIQRLVDFMRTEWNMSVVFLPFGSGYGGENQGKYLKTQVDDLVLFENANGYLKIEEATNIIRNANFVLCDRYHALVFSMANNVPCIQALREIDGSYDYYYNKCQGTLEKVLGKDEKLMNLFTVNSLETMLEYTCDQFGEIAHRQKLYYNKNKEKGEVSLRKTRTKFIQSLQKT